LINAGAMTPPGARRRPWLLAVVALALLVGVGVGLGVAELRAHAGASADGRARAGGGAGAATATGTGAPAAATGLRGQATWAAGVRPAPPITTLPDQTGRLFSLTGLRGRTVAMVFFDSYCHQECPLEGRALAAAEQSLPAASRPVLVVVSVNPRDTPASAAAAMREWGLAGLAPWHWLHGTRAQLARVWAAYHIYVAPHPVNGDISHTEALYLIDRRGDERSAYLYPFTPRFVTHDLGVLAVAHGARG
jgi:cytochrome oxidase Cu insertion factor (SCO1/SenC/PrrC family)